MDYFVTVNGRQLDPIQFPGPATDLLNNEQVPVCDCEAARIPFIDINATLSWNDAHSLARELLNAHGHGGKDVYTHKKTYRNDF